MGIAIGIVIGLVAGGGVVVAWLFLTGQLQARRRAPDTPAHAPGGEA